MAKQLYDYWFVQFDFPNEEGKPYKSSGGAMKYDNYLNCQVPESWESSNLGKILDILKDGTHNPPKRVANGVPLLTGTMFGNNFLEYSKATYISNEDYSAIHKQYQPKCNDIILTKIGTLGNINLLRQSDIPIAIHCNSALLRFPEWMGISYPFFMCKSPLFYARLKSVKGQSIQEFASLERISSIKIELPHSSLIEKFNSVIDPIIEKMKRISEEIDAIKKQRDELLPLLMNGQVSVTQLNSDLTLIPNCICRINYIVYKTFFLFTLLMILLDLPILLYYRLRDDLRPELLTMEAAFEMHRIHQRSSSSSLSRPQPDMLPPPPPQEWA